MLKVTCFAGMFLGVIMAVYGTWLPRAEAQLPKSNQKCVTILAPGTCQMTGETACRTDDDTGMPCRGACYNCDSTVALTGKVCIGYPESTCTPNGNTIDCGATTNEEKGRCSNSMGQSTCSCGNPIATGAMCGAGSVANNCNN